MGVLCFAQWAVEMAILHADAWHCHCMGLLFVIPVLSVTKTKSSGGILCPNIWFKSCLVNPVGVLCEQLESIGAIAKLNFTFVSRWLQYFMRDIMLWRSSCEIM